MIYIGLPEHEKQLIMAYKILATVFQSEREMFLKVFEEACSTIVLTDGFIEKYLHWSSIPELCSQLRRIKRTCKIVIIGTNIKVESADAYNIRIPWDNPSWTLRQIEEKTVDPITYKPRKENDIMNMLRVNLNSPEFLVDYLITNQQQVLPELKRLIDERDFNDVINLQSLLDTLVVENSRLQEDMARQKDRYAVLETQHNSIKADHEALLSKINNQYNISYSEECIHGIDVQLCQYRGILYIKELTRVHYVDSLLHYLQCILNSLYERPTRFVVIEKEYAYNSTKLYPNHIPHYKITYSELKSANILTIGYQRDILSSILQNPSQASYLIILDRSGHDFLSVRGDGVKVMYTLSDLKDNQQFGVPDDVLISYNTGTYTIPYVEGFESMSDRERIAEYSSMETTKAILSALEGGV